MTSLADRIAGKRIFVSNGTPEGHIALIKECGRVMATVPLPAVDDRDLAEVDQVSLNYEDAHRLGIDCS